MQTAFEIIVDDLAVVFIAAGVKPSDTQAEAVFNELGRNQAASQPI